MLIPLELSILSRKKGFVSPELSLGWKLGTYISEFFNGFEGIRIAAKSWNDSVTALNSFSKRHYGNEKIIVAGADRPWDFLFYHVITGTALKIVQVPGLTTLPECIKSLEGRLEFLDLDTVSFYKKAVNELIIRILEYPLEKLCSISEYRCRRIHLTEQQIIAGKICRNCDRLIQNSQIWDIDGVVCCDLCSGLEPSWFIYH